MFSFLIQFKVLNRDPSTKWSELVRDFTNFEDAGPVYVREFLTPSYK